MGEAKPEETKPEEPKPEEKKEEKPEEKKEEAKPSPPPPIVLFVDLHCVGCAKKIERSIMKCRGVEEVMTDMVQNQVTVKGIVDPQALCSRIQKKTLRKARVISPLPSADGDPSKIEVVASQVNGITTVELQVNMHCEACAQQLKKKILKMRGVQTAETELKAGKVTVTGTMDAEKLADYIHRRTGKIAKIIPPPPPPPKEEEKKEEPEKKIEEKPPEEKKEEQPVEEKKEEGKTPAPPPQENADGGGSKEEKAAEEEPKKEGDVQGGGDAAIISEEDMMKKMMYWAPVYVIERLPLPPAPQIFSDENPNACCIS